MAMSEPTASANVVLSNRSEIDVILTVTAAVVRLGRTGWIAYGARGKNSAIFQRGIRRPHRYLGACRGCFHPPSAAAQTGEPLKIGYSMALSGGLGPNGRSALLAQKIWEEDTNAKGGLLGRRVKLIYDDDQTNPATVPGIYGRLLDVHKVELIIGPYGTNLQAPAVPIAMQRKKVFIGLLG